MKTKITVTENNFVMTAFTSAKDFAELNEYNTAPLRLKLVRCSSHKRVKKYRKNRRYLINNDQKHILLTSKHVYSKVPNRSLPVYQFSFFFFSEIPRNASTLKTILYGPFLWMEFNCLKVVWEPLWGGSLLFTTKFPEVPSILFIDLGRMKGWIDRGAT